MNKKRQTVLFFILLIVLLGLDRYTKNLALEHLNGQEPLSCLNDTVHLTYTENAATFLGFNVDFSERISYWFFIVLPLFFCLLFFSICIVNIFTTISSFNSLLPLGLVFIGYLGNTIDHMRYHYHKIGFINIKGLHSGTFNIADLCQTIGGILLIFLFFKKKRYKGLSHE